MVTKFYLLWIVIWASFDKLFQILAFQVHGSQMDKILQEQRNGLASDVIWKLPNSCRVWLISQWTINTSNIVPVQDEIRQVFEHLLVRTDNGQIGLFRHRSILGSATWPPKAAQNPTQAPQKVTATIFGAQAINFVQSKLHKLLHNLYRVMIGLRWLFGNLVE